MKPSKRTYEPFAATLDYDGDVDTRWPLLLKLDQDSHSRQSLRFSTVVQYLIVARLVSAIFNNINDCDETFNYLEPLHLLLKGSGLQTWEYSPQYAIRSYAYLWLYAAPMWLFSYVLDVAPLLAFYLFRIGCALVSTASEAYLYSGLMKQFGPEVARISLAILLFSAGMFVSSTAVLPSTFTMYATCVAYAAYWHRHYRISIIACGASVLIGWPFGAILKLPIILDLLSTRKRLYFVQWGLLVATFLSVFLITIDSYYYGKFVLAPLNIVLYNVFTSHGANLYGTEPWTYYARNLILNFNIAFIFCLIAPLLIAISWCSKKIQPKLCCRQSLVPIIACFLWFVIFFLQAHKEERFLFPVYSLISVLAAFSIVSLRNLIISHTPILTKFFFTLMKCVFVAFIFLSTSRCLALYQGYHAPLKVFGYLSYLHQTERMTSPVNVCVAKEWHRFPSSFFLPDNKVWTLRFVQSEFRGQLPQPFLSGPQSTRTIRENFNDLNREEIDRYIDPAQCDYLVDSDYPEFSERDRPYSKMKDIWDVVLSVSFLNANASPVWLRAFYIPFFSEHYCSYIDYNLLKNKRLKKVNI